MTDSLMKRIERDGVDAARGFLLAREERRRMPSLSGNRLEYLRGELAGLARCVMYVTGEEIDAVERRWLEVGAEHFTVPDATRAAGVIGDILDKAPGAS